MSTQTKQVFNLIESFASSKKWKQIALPKLAHTINKDKVSAFLTNYKDNNGDLIQINFYIKNHQRNMHINVGVPFMAKRWIIIGHPTFLEKELINIEEEIELETMLYGQD